MERAQPAATARRAELLYAFASPRMMPASILAVGCTAAEGRPACVNAVEKIPLRASDLAPLSMGFSLSRLTNREPTFSPGGAKLYAALKDNAFNWKTGQFQAPLNQDL